MNSRDFMREALIALGGKEIDGRIYGKDSTSEDRDERQAWLIGRLRAAALIQMPHEYDVPVPTGRERPDEKDFVMTNKHSGKRYRVSVEELD